MDYIGSGYCSSTRYQVSILLLQEQRADQCFLCVLTIFIHADPFPTILPLCSLLLLLYILLLPVQLFLLSLLHILSY